MTPRHPKPLAAAYFDYQQTRNENDSWAWEAVDVLGFDDPIGKWTQILTLVSAAPDDWAIGLLAAGPLEDLLKYHGGAIIDLVEHEARVNAGLRSALAGVWLEPGPTADRVARIRAS